MNRRRFIAITAASIAEPVRVQAETRWQGLALGARAQITLRGPGGNVAMRHALAILRSAESEFSLYRADSALSRLNQTGKLRPSAPFRALMKLCDRLYYGTGGIFEPTVQALWTALAEGTDIGAASRLVGWDRVETAPFVTLGPGQSMTLNGIAQGFVTDLVSEALAEVGFAETLVNIGEFRAGLGDWRIGVEASDGVMLDEVALSRGALAVSSSAGTSVGGRSHILSATGLIPQWSTVAVTAPSAALADGLSTALCLADEVATSEIATYFPEAGIRQWK